MNLTQQLSTNNDCYKNNVNKLDSRYTTFQTRGPLGIMLHSVGCPQPKAQVFADTWNQPRKEVAVHAALEPGRVIQCLPWNFRGCHGGGDCNNTHIGVEMTEPSTIRYTSGARWEETGDGTGTKAHILGAYKTAVELFAHLCKEYRLDPVKAGVIVSHAEGCRCGIASNHADPEHLWNVYGLTMDRFRQDIKAAMEGGTPAPESPPPTQTPSVFQPYVVRVTHDELKIRSGPGTNYDRIGEITDRGLYTIVEESSGLGATKWGKLKSGTGWISLDYTSR
ncbi:MAG: N-acetylmuramoyl-L-alanine amidase [Betaproteobacteria bacterium]|nr:N-acetylmuramoyl-L-alanine amidase [Betaproteobacteria bacterium]